MLQTAVPWSLPNVIGNRIKFTVIPRTIAYFYFISLNWQTTSQHRLRRRAKSNAKERERKRRKQIANKINAKWDPTKDSVYYYNAIAIIIDKIKKKPSNHSLVRCAMCCGCGGSVYVDISQSQLQLVAAKNEDNEKFVSEGIACNAQRTNTTNICEVMCVCDEVLNTIMGK